MTWMMSRRGGAVSRVKTNCGHHYPTSADRWDGVISLTARPPDSSTGGPPLDCSRVASQCQPGCPTTTLLLGKCTCVCGGGGRLCACSVCVCRPTHGVAGVACVGACLSICAPLGFFSLYFIKTSGYGHQRLLCLFQTFSINPPSSIVHTSQAFHRFSVFCTPWPIVLSRSIGQCLGVQSASLHQSFTIEMSTSLLSTVYHLYQSVCTFVQLFEPLPSLWIQSFISTRSCALLVLQSNLEDTELSSYVV